MHFTSFPLVDLGTVDYRSEYSQHQTSDSVDVLKKNFLESAIHAKTLEDIEFWKKSPKENVSCKNTLKPQLVLTVDAEFTIYSILLQVLFYRARSGKHEIMRRMIQRLQLNLSRDSSALTMRMSQLFLFGFFMFLFFFRIGSNQNSMQVSCVYWTWLVISVR